MDDFKIVDGAKDNFIEMETNLYTISVRLLMGWVYEHFEEEERNEINKVLEKILRKIRSE